MDIYYRILGYNLSEHSIEVRYWTDEINEFDLCSLFNETGSPQLTADGYPRRCRTDVNITLYSTPSPNEEALKEVIMNNAPIQWFKLVKDIKSDAVDTSLASVVTQIKKKNKFNIEL